MAIKRIAVDIDDRTWTKFRAIALMADKPTAVLIAELINSYVQRKEKR